MKRQRQDGLRKLCTCPLRRWPRCDHPWHFSYKPKGRDRVRVSLDRYAGERVEGLGKARTVAGELRAAVDAGTYPKPAMPETTTVTFQTAVTRFLEHVPVLRGKRQGQRRGESDRQKLSTLCAWTPPASVIAVGAMPVAAVTEDVYEAFVQQLRVAGRTPATLAKYIQSIALLDRWMAKRGYRPATVISGESDVLRRSKGARRDRRLTPDTLDDKGKVLVEGEERRLLKAANPWMQRLIIAAIETGARRGELLALRWQDVDMTRSELTIQAASNKTGEGRRLPISPRLRSVLELLRLDPKEQERPRHHFVFGNAIGEAVASSKKAWETAVLKAHGHKAIWSAKKGLASESRAALRAIDLHFHDLRHEAGSRMLEAGWPLHHVQRMLGHANVAQTATYLNAHGVGLHDSMKRFGTKPAWQTVANDPQIEQRPDCHDDAPSEPQPTIN